MAQLEQYQQQIQNTLKKLTHTIHRSPLFSSDKTKWSRQCNKLMQNSSDYIHTYEEMIGQMPASSVGHYVASCKRFKKQLKQCRQDFQAKSREEAGALNPTLTNENPGRSLIMQTIQRGDDTQGRINEALLSMDQTVSQGISIADQVNLELNRQIEQLDRIHGKVKDTQSSLKRAQKSINYFMKALECDKCMLGLILLIVLALIALIVLIAKKN